jgi:hypothetical protein
MGSWFVRAADHPSDRMSQRADLYFSKLSKLYEQSGVRYRAPLAIALLSVAFQEYPLWIRVICQSIFV